MNTAKRMYELVASEYEELSRGDKQHEEEKKETLSAPPVREKQRSAARLAFEEKKASFKAGASAPDLVVVGNGKARAGSRERGSSRKPGKKKRGSSAVSNKRGKKKT